MNWYILFTRTGHENRVEQLLRKQLDKDTFLPFIPMLEILYKTAGKIRKEVKPLFPGYVFIETEVMDEEFSSLIKKLVLASNDIFKLLRYGNTYEFALREEERIMLMRLYNENYCIEKSSGIKVGSTVYIKEGPLKGLESIITKIDRHKRRAIINLSFMGAFREISVSLEIIELSAYNCNTMDNMMALEFG